MLIALSLYYEDLGSKLDSRRADAKSTPSYFLRPTYISIIIMPSIGIILEYR